jgi:outer membrane protein OmpA-like peptidoglycan-associated protein
MLLGIVVLAAIGLGAVGLFAVGNGKWPWSDALYLRAGFSEIRGIEPGSRVRVKGEDAGEVVEILSPEQPSAPVVLRLRLHARFRGRIRTDAVAQIVSDGFMGGKLIEIHPGSDQAAAAADNALLSSRPGLELTDLADRVGAVLADLREQKAGLGELIQNSKTMVKQGEETMKSFQDVSDAVKRFPVVRSYVEDPLALLYRPGVERNRKWFAEADLFPPGQARLTTQGEQRLSEVVPWLAGLTRHKGAEVVVVSYADAKATPAAIAPKLTREQSEAVAQYLKNHGAIHKDYWLLSRKVTPFGRGTQPPPAPEKEDLPPARVEVLVFVPQS